MKTATHFRTSPIRACLFLAAVATAIPTALDAAVFAKYDGVDGESTTDPAGHDQWIDVLSIDWGMHRPGGGTTARRGGVVVRDLQLTIAYDKASPKVAEKCLLGAVIPKLEIDFTATYGESRVTYLKYELKNVMITSFQVNASGNDEAGPPTVVVGNNFEELKVTYTEYDNSGGSQGDTEYEWRVEENVAGALREEGDPAEEPQN